MWAWCHHTMRNLLAGNVDVTASLQANSMASALCFAQSSKSEQCTYDVIFTSAIQLCLCALCICNIAVLQAILRW